MTKKLHSKHHNRSKIKNNKDTSNGKTGIDDYYRLRINHRDQTCHVSFRLKKKSLKKKKSKSSKNLHPNYNSNQLGVSLSQSFSSPIDNPHDIAPAVVKDHKVVNQNPQNLYIFSHIILYYQVAIKQSINKKLV